MIAPWQEFEDAALEALYRAFGADWTKHLHLAHELEDRTRGACKAHLQKMHFYGFEVGVAGPAYALPQKIDWPEPGTLIGGKFYGTKLFADIGPTRAYGSIGIGAPSPLHSPCGCSAAWAVGGGADA